MMRSTILGLYALVFAAPALSQVDVQADRKTPGEVRLEGFKSRNMWPRPVNGPQ
jgi:hypothetical protein